MCSRNFFAIISLALLVTMAAGAAQLRQVGVLDIAGPPGFDEAAFADGMLVLSHTASNSLDVFDPARRRMVAQVTGLAGPRGLAVDARNGRVYVANPGARNVVVISSRGWKIERTIALDAEAYSLALAANGRQLYTGNWRERSVTSIDLTSGKKMTVDVAGSPQGTVLDSVRQRLYVALQDTAEVAVLDAATLQVAGRYKVAASQPTGVALDAAGRRIFVAARHAVVALNADDGNEMGRAKVPAGADSLWLDTAQGRLYVASSGGIVNVLRTDSALTPVEEIRTEVRGHVLAYDPARGYLYMPGGREGRSKLLILRQIAPAERTEPQVAIR